MSCGVCGKPASWYVHRVEADAPEAYTFRVHTCDEHFLPELARAGEWLLRRGGGTRAPGTVRSGRLDKVSK